MSNSFSTIPLRSRAEVIIPPAEQTKTGSLPFLSFESGPQSGWKVIAGLAVGLGITLVAVFRAVIYGLIGSKLNGLHPGSLLAAGVKVALIVLPMGNSGFRTAPSIGRKLLLLSS